MDVEDSELQKELAEITSSNLAIGDQIQEFSKRLQDISTELQLQVKDNYGALLQQATSASRFDNAINILAADVQNLRTTGKRLQTQVNSQYQTLENQSRVLERVHDISHLLRSAGTLLTLTAKLRNTKDVLKQASIHYELSPLLEDVGLKNVDFVQNARAYVIGSQQKIRNLTQMQLVNGLHERNETNVITALKIFMNFNTLDKSLDNLIMTFTTNMEQSLEECFAGNDITVLHSAKADTVTTGKTGGSAAAGGMRGPGKTPQLTTTQNFRAKFWKSLHWLLYDELFEYCTQIKLLKRALDQVHFVSVSQTEEASVQQRYWQAVHALMRRSFKECPPHVAQTLQEGLAKLLSSVRGLEQRLDGEFRFEDDLFNAFETGYLSKCSANMKACSAGIDLPNNETVDNLMRVATAELSASLIDGKLSSKVAAIFVACGKDLCTKLEAQIKLGADTKQVVDTPNTQQVQNTLLANILHYYKDSTRRMVQDLREQLSSAAPSSAEQDIISSLKQADLLINLLLQPLMDSILSTMNIIIMSMHREPGIGTEKISTAGPSMFMKELQEFIARVWRNHIDAFDDKVIVGACGEELARRCIDLFVHNLSILRPVSAAGRQRLKNDCAHMEQALQPLCSAVATLGKPARLLRAMAHMICLNPTELVQQPVSDESLVPSYIVLFLLFGHAGADLQSPHSTVNWSRERLIEWLDGHSSEREKLELISGALQRYRDDVRRKNSAEYDAIYPMMVEFFEQTLKANH